MRIRIAAPLGAAYALAGRSADAVPLLTQALEQVTATGTVIHQALCGLSLGEAQLLAGQLEEAHALTEGVLAHARERADRGSGGPLAAALPQLRSPPFFRSAV